MLPLTYLVNLSLTKGTFPSQWKKARICPIFKEGDSTEPCNYRPISILPVSSKAIERAVFDQMYPFLDGKAMIYDNQSGFRPNYSTSSALLHITEEWLNAIDESKYIGIVMLDLKKKLFDTVNHSILLRKLCNYGLSLNVIEWFESDLEDRKHVTTINGVKSEEEKCTCGIPQGSILGPLLFILYINDLPNHVSNVTVSMYADDTALFYSSNDINEVVDKINGDLVKMDDWLSRNRLCLNVNKTKFMLVGTSQKLACVSNQDLDVNIKGIPLQKVNHAKHLGIIIDETLDWSDQVNHVIKKVSTGLYCLRKSTNVLPKHIQLMLYKTIIAPHFDYCNIVWGRCNKLLNNKLQVLQNRAAKIITGKSVRDSSSQALSDLKWKNLDEKLYYNESVTMYKIMNNQAPHYLTSGFTHKETKYELRNSSALYLSRPRTEYKRRSFYYRGAKLWNSLDENTKCAINLMTFKGVLHHWALFLKTLCIFSKNKATSDKISYGFGLKCSKELKNHSFASVETIVVRLQ